MSLKVLVTSTSYPSSGNDWKGLFIQRMAEALARRPDLDLRLWTPPGIHPANTGTAWQAGDARWLEGLAARGGIAHLLRTRPARGTLSAAQLLWRLRRAFRRDDSAVLHVNWLQNALALPADGRPVLVSVLGTDMALMRVPMVTALLRRAFRHRRVAICPNADWMVPALARAFGDVAQVHCVPFGVDASWYRVAREPVGATPRRWLCVTRLTQAKLGPLFEWAAPHFDDTSRELHLFGPRQEAGIEVPGWVRFHGPATPEQLRDTWFPSATGLVTMSRHDEGRPQVMLEARAAGLPILASSLAAHADIVEHAVDGWLCDDPEGFAEGLAVLEDPVRNHAMGVRARASARDRFGDWDDCAARYAVHYQRLLGRGGT